MSKPTYEELEAQIKQLAAERDAVVAENAALKYAIETHSESVHFCEVCGKDDPCSTDDVCYVLKETPATDAAIASLRAEAIEFAAYHLPNNGKYEDMILTLADEVREGLTEVKIPAPKYERSQSEQVKHE